MVLFLWPVEYEPWPGKGVVHQAGDVYWVVACSHCGHVQIPNTYWRYECVYLSQSVTSSPGRGVDNHCSWALDLVLESGDLAGVQTWHLHPWPQEIEGPVPLPRVSWDLVIQIYSVTHRAQALVNIFHYEAKREIMSDLLIYSKGDLFSEDSDSQLSEWCDIYEYLRKTR